MGSASRFFLFLICEIHLTEFHVIYKFKNCDLEIYPRRRGLTITMSPRAAIVSTMPRGLWWTLQHNWRTLSTSLTCARVVNFTQVIVRTRCHDNRWIPLHPRGGWYLLSPRRLRLVAGYRLQRRRVAIGNTSSNRESLRNVNIIYKSWRNP